MTQTLGVNSSNDLYIGANGNLVVLQGQNAVEAACQSASLAQLGEMVLATLAGIPNFQAVWVGTPNLAIFQSYLRQTIENVNGVLSVVSLSSSVSQNTLSYNAKISTIYGLAEINGAIPS